MGEQLPSNKVQSLFVDIRGDLQNVIQSIATRSNGIIQPSDITILRWHMSVGVRVGSIVDEVGASSFFNSFFSTIWGLLEPKGPGTKYPVVSSEFYEGSVSAQHVEKALEELRAIREELKNFPPTAVIWDYEDRSKQPPWGSDISSDITSMSNYFVSSTGRDLFDLLIEAFDDAKQNKSDVAIEEV
ncbi:MULTISPECIES: Imm70 family immunity protein [Burkholderia]|uniref:Imm70 family immunity protein n=1 Tax=Burkholderia TaxID=32008 RepID=UPI001965E9F2|nr:MULTISPECIES: Imm70 family immunity protein [Burkholderia]